ncbi:hypothetical protein ABK040_005909 [Willaertia magna]
MSNNNKRTSNESTTSNNYQLEDYQFVFEQVFDNAEARTLFKDYLSKDIHSPEGVKFYESIEQYKLLQSSQNRLREAQKIIETFINPHAELCINIGNSERNGILEKWEQIKKNNADPPSDLFEDAFLLIFRELKEDVFPRFIRCEKFKNFMLKRSKSYWDEIGQVSAIHLSKKNELLDTQNSNLHVEEYWKGYEADCSVFHITGEDVRFLNSLQTDSNQWKLLVEGNSKNKEYFASFVSKSKFDVIKPGTTEERNPNAQKLFKSTGIVNYSVEQVLFTLCNPKYMLDYDNQLSVIDQIDYIKMSDELNENDLVNLESKEEKFSSTVILENYPFSWPISNRDFVTCQSVIFEAKTQRYLIVKKSVSHPNALKRRGTVRGYQIGGWVLTRVNDTQCRYSLVTYTDMDMNEKVFNQFCKKRGKQLFYGLNQTLKKNEIDGFPKPETSCGLLETLFDFCKRYRIKSSIVNLNYASTVEKSEHDLKKEKYRSYEINGSLIRLTYISKFDVNRLNEEDFKSISHTAVNHNHPKLISGILLCCEGLFYQVLEGEPSVVYPLYEKIKKDKRHFDVRCVNEEKNVREQDRQYGEWAMNVVNLLNTDNYFAQFMKQLIAIVSKLDVQGMSEKEALSIIANNSKLFVSTHQQNLTN